MRARCDVRIATAFRTSQLVIRLGFVVALSSCADNAFEPIVACSDDQVVTVRVSAGTTPRFTWRPSCGMASVQVAATETSSDGWVLYSGSHAAENPLPSGLRYGEVPDQGVEPAPEARLQRGVEYRVSVYRWIGDSGGPGSLFERGAVTFRP